MNRISGHFVQGKTKPPPCYWSLVYFYFICMKTLDSEGFSIGILSMLIRESLTEAPCFTDSTPLSSQSMDIFRSNLHMERLWMLNYTELLD